MIYFCCDQLRRNAVRGSALNGIDFLEVVDHAAPNPADRQRFLRLHLLNPMQPPASPAPGKANVRIEGGERISPVNVLAVTPGTGAEANILTVEVDRAGDFSRYLLRLVKDPGEKPPAGLDPTPPDGFDPPLSSIGFSFKVECPSDLDCLPQRFCVGAAAEEPEIDYLARDFSSFRQLLLDRLAVLLPRWPERSPADMGIALVELLAYVGDYLAYQQDAIATEAYLHTARRRVSARRHARLIDYFMHDGCNARVWVQVQVSADLPAGLPLHTPLCTRIPGQPVALADPAALDRAQAVFEVLWAPAGLRQAHNAISFYTWGDRECCLPKGATRATLSGHLPHLKPNDVLIFEEVLGPLTGRAEDADPSRRHAVLLTTVVATAPDSTPLTDRLTGTPITQVVWHDDDALPVPICLSSRTDAAHGLRYLEDISVARGNVLLADHGRSLTGESLGQVPPPRLFLPLPAGNDRCQGGEPVPIPPRYRPSLREQPVTQATPFTPPSASHPSPASAALGQDPPAAVPAVKLASLLAGEHHDWFPLRDLLNSLPNDRAFVVEVELDGTAYLRFGDNQHGTRPDPETAFTADYRVGNGVAGNIGAEALAHVLTKQPGILLVRNPMPARGGAEPESIEDVRQRAPTAFRIQERAVTADDYAVMAQRDPNVLRAQGTFRWTGSWHTAFVTVERAGGKAVDDSFAQTVRSELERYRMAGTDLEIDRPRFVALEIHMHVCVRPDYFRAQVKAALLQLFSNRTLPDGRLGLFHPSRFSFGEPVYLGSLYAAAQSVAGVASVEITTFQRFGVPDPGPLAAGVLILGRLEIARLDNDPDFPEHGLFCLDVGGGK
jgi:hypothetical protein